MRKRIIYICVFIVILLLIVYFIALPIIKWNISYDLSSVTSGERAVEYYLDAIHEKNPKKALTIYPSLNDSDLKAGIFSFLSIEYCKLNNIEEIEGYSDDLLSPEEKIFHAEFSWRFAFNITPNVFIGLTDGDGSELYFHVAKNKDTGNWYIVDAYTGV